MLRVAILFSLLIISSAKIHNERGLDNDYVDVELPNPNPTWVLKVGSGELELKPASPDEEEEFEENSGLSNDIYKTKPGVRSPRPPAKVNESFVVVKEDIFRLLNKFALFSNVEPDSYLSGSDDNDTSLTIFFKNPVTALIVTVGQKQWHFYITSNSPLPLWFYENHAQKAGKFPDTVKIPNDVKQRFYISLWRLLRVILNYPL